MYINHCDYFIVLSLYIKALLIGELTLVILTLMTSDSLLRNFLRVRSFLRVCEFGERTNTLHELMHELFPEVNTRFPRLSPQGLEFAVKRGQIKMTLSNM